ncbi:MAG: penicillin-binding protein [Firmicutes bacterium]|nr:penicillin-binding protein [Bacillota bacterium]
MKPDKRPGTVEKTPRPNTIIMRRVLILMALFGIGTFLLLFGKLWEIQVIKHDQYEEIAVRRQTSDIAVSANRGKITDSKGSTLAISTSVNNVILSPRDVKKNKLDEDLIATGLAQILGVDEESIRKRLARTNSAWENVAPKVEDDVADQVRAFISENKLSGGLYLTPDSKRKYPSSSLAAHILGFVNYDNVGAYGLEAVYESELSGEKGRIVTARNAAGTEMPTGYEAYVDAQSGYNLQLTIDSTIQYYLERTLEEGVQRFDVLEGAFGIVMNPKTGAILAMASSPNYDANNYGTVKDAQLLEKINTLKAGLDGKKAALAEVELTLSQLAGSTTVEGAVTGQEAVAAIREKAAAEQEKEILEDEITTRESEYQAALRDAQLTQWRNKAVVDTYEPGSTFKPIVMAMALEEGAVHMTDTYYCGGSITVPGWPEPIRCHVYPRSHGTQNPTQVLMNSCNPAMIQIGQKIGTKTFYSYIEDFGLLNKTGIDLLGEERGDFWSAEEFGSNLVSLATASFGQRFQVTPLGLITALSSVINGGHLMEPYVVQSVTDTEGNVVRYREPKEVRQVISQETSDTVRAMMEQVVSTGTGKNAKVEGYAIGGKTGTSQTKESGHLITSFVGFAPADDPEFILLLAYDHPKPASPGANTTAGGYYISGGNMAALMAGGLMGDILNYMGVPKQGAAAAADKEVPNLVGKTLEEAKSTLQEQELSWKVRGDGATVTGQTPNRGAFIPAGSTVILYMDEEKGESKVAVPDVQGRTYSSAKSQLEGKGLYIKAPGVDNASNMVAFSQSIEPGTMVDPGTVIEVRFRDNNVKEYAN